MKKVIILLICSIIWTSNNAQGDAAAINAKIAELNKQKAGLEAEISTLKASIPTPIWSYKGNAAINVGQNLLGSNWMSSYGGNSTLNLGGVAHVEANYKKGRNSWDNSFDGLMGFFKNINVDSGVNDRINKNADMLQISSKYLYDLQKGNLKVGIGMNFLSQFTKTFSLDKDVLLSDFLAPGILDLSPGIQWTPAPYFNVFFAPASGRMTFVANSDISSLADETKRFGNGLDEAVRTELGARAVLSFEKELVKNLSVRSKAQLFNNYSRPDAQITAIESTRANVDVNWQTDLFYKLTKSIALNFGFQVMRDDDVRIVDKMTGLKSAEWNWRNNIGVGFVAGF